VKCDEFMKKMKMQRLLNLREALKGQWAGESSAGSLVRKNKGRTADETVVRKPGMFARSNFK